MSDSQNLAFNRVSFPRIYWKRRMFYSKPLASLPLTEFSPSSSPISLGFSLSLSLSFPFSTTVNTEQARARHVSRHNHRALSGMIKFSTARLTEFPFSQEKSCERRERERERDKEGRENIQRKEKRRIHYRGYHWFFPVPTEFRVWRHCGMRQTWFPSVSLVVRRNRLPVKQF